MKGFNAFILLLIFQFFVIILAFSFYILLTLNNALLKNSNLINVFQNGYNYFANSLAFMFIFSLFISLADSYLNPSYLKALVYFIFFLAFGYLYASTQNIFVSFFNASQGIFIKNTTIRNTFQNAYAFLFNENYAFLTFILLGFNIIVNLYAIRKVEAYE
jgi:hypothetical protein